MPSFAGASLMWSSASPCLARASCRWKPCGRSRRRRMIEVRALSAHDQLREAVRLQQEIWGFADLDLIPPRMFVVAAKIGGQVFGAFDSQRMIAFLIAIPGLRADSKSYLHSHMLGVLPEYRDRGVGRMLKLAQRDDALSRGIDLIEWTFDPLELKNAFFNIER